MAYKDKDKQRAYQRDWVRHKRQGSTGSTSTNGQSVTSHLHGQAWPEPVASHEIETKEVVAQKPAKARYNFGPLTKEQQVKGFNK